jgi:hypothetical protein
MYLHLFKCVPAEVFAATADSRGSNLPNQFGGKWKYLRGATIMPADSPTLAFDPQAVLTGIRERGYHLWGAGLEGQQPPPRPAAPSQDGAAASC